MTKKLKLAWFEDFSSERLDESVWSYELGYIRNNELQKYTDNPENVFIKDGMLHLRAIKTDDLECPYTSASINTYDKKTFLYGRLEMCAKLPYGSGIWPAFWTLGEDILSVGWPKCGEIDIMEMIGGRGDLYDNQGDKEIFSTIHYPSDENDNPAGRKQSAFLLDECYCDRFHIIGMMWDKEYISFYVDGIIWKRVNILELPQFHKPHYLLLNLAIGGDWPGEPDENTNFPMEYIIKWIKYWQPEA